MSEQETRRFTKADEFLKLIFGEVVDDILSPLGSLEEVIIRKSYQHHFGFGPRLTQTQIGREFNSPLSRWQVGRIERRARGKLRVIHRPKRLRDYLE